MHNFCIWLLFNYTKPITPADLLEKTVSICILNFQIRPQVKTIIPILSSCIFIMILTIFKRKLGRAKSLDCAMCENETGAILAKSECRITVQNQQCKSRSGRVTFISQLWEFSLCHFLLPQPLREQQCLTAIATQISTTAQ